MAAHIVAFHPKSETAPPSSFEPRLLNFRPKPEPSLAGNAKLHKGLDTFLATTNDQHVRVFLSEIVGSDQIDPNRNMKLHELLDEVLSRVGAQRIEDSFRSFKAILARPVTAWVDLGLSRSTVCEQWRALLAQPRSSGSIAFNRTCSQKPPLKLSFELWPVDTKFSELSLSGLGIVAQHILVRRIVNKGRLQWRFYCSRCERTRFNTLVLFHKGPNPEFLCNKCPEFHSNWEAWRYRGDSYSPDEINVDEKEQTQ